MQFQYVSDLHLEFPENKAFLTANPIRPQAEVLLMAGDILPFFLIDKHQDFFDWLSSEFKLVYWVPGNHEYYHYDMALKNGAFREKIRDNVILLNNQVERLDDVDLVCSTLWSKLEEKHWWQIRGRMNDFRIIKYGEYPLSFDQYNQLHMGSVDFLNGAFQSDGFHPEKAVVVSHHVPTFINYPEQFRHSVLNEAFAVELSPLIEDIRPSYWIYGHHHVNMPDFEIGNTHVITNQLGYVRYQEHTLFQTDKTFSL